MYLFHGYIAHASFMRTTSCIALTYDTVHTSFTPTPCIYIHITSCIPVLHVPHRAYILHNTYYIVHTSLTRTTSCVRLNTTLYIHCTALFRTCLCESRTPGVVSGLPCACPNRAGTHQSDWASSSAGFLGGLETRLVLLPQSRTVMWVSFLCDNRPI